MNFYTAIANFDEYLDAEVGELYKQSPFAQDWARIAKVIEELGECVSNFIGYTGQNPRKGIYSSQREMLKELADTALTCVLAIQHFTKSEHLTEEVLIGALQHNMRRIGIS